jgi:hypothetical protein
MVRGVVNDRQYEFEYSFCIGDGKAVAVRLPSNFEEAELFKMNSPFTEETTTARILREGYFDDVLFTFLNGSVRGKQLISEGRVTAAARLEGNPKAIDSLNEILQLDNPTEIGTNQLIKSLMMNKLEYTGDLKRDADALRALFGILDTYDKLTRPVKVGGAKFSLRMGPTDSKIFAYYLNKTRKNLDLYEQSKNETILKLVKTMKQIIDETIKDLNGPDMPTVRFE